MSSISTTTTDCWGEEPLTEDEINHIHRSKNATTTTSDRSVPKLTLDVMQSSLHKLRPTFNDTLDYLFGEHDPQKMRQSDFRSKVENCTTPYYYGGGKSAGVLWYDYMKIKTTRRNRLRQRRPASYEEIWNAEFVKAIHQALIPHAKWRQLATKCITHHLPKPSIKDGGNFINMTTSSYSSSPSLSSHGGSGGGYAVLHARIETDMMVHRCGKDMERNLTNILEQVDSFLQKYNFGAGRTRKRIEGTMIAVNRDGMLEDYPNTKQMTLHNLDVLNQRSISYDNGTYTIEGRSQQSQRHQSPHGQPRRPKLPILFECGEGWVDEAYYKQQRQQQQQQQHDTSTRNYYGDLLPSLLSFWLAVEADIFVGVMKSSWSNDVWTTRYYLGKGSTNYQYTKDTGVIPVPDNGLPRTHQC
jgi:hypothetical protein